MEGLLNAADILKGAVDKLLQRYLQLVHLHIEIHVIAVELTQNTHTYIHTLGNIISDSFDSSTGLLYFVQMEVQQVMTLCTEGFDNLLECDDEWVQTLEALEF